MRFDGDQFKAAAAALGRPAGEGGVPEDAPLWEQTYALACWSAPGPRGAIPLLTYHRRDLPGPKPAIIYYHGVAQRKEDYLDSHSMSRALADAGFMVVIPDAPGHGERESAGGLIERLTESLPREFAAAIEQSADEAGALIDWLERRPEVDVRRIGVIGVSMGGYTAAAVGARQKERVRAVVCINGAAELELCMATTDAIAPGKWGPPDRAIDPRTRQTIAVIDPINYPERFPPLPILLVHGMMDTWNPCITSQRFAAALLPHYRPWAERLKLLIVPGAVHWPPNRTMVRESVAWLLRYVCDASQEGAR
mgnify:CR=1 FL=1